MNQKKEATKQTQVTIKQLLKSYAELEKKTIPEGRKIRKQLRKLGYFLSQEKKEKKAKAPKAKKVKEVEELDEEELA